MTELKLFFNGEFAERNVEIIDKMKNGEITSKDEKGKAVHYRVPALVWKTEDGNFDSRNLDVVKVADNYFFVKTENTTEYAVQLLKDHAITYFEGLASTATQRIETLRQNIQEQEIKLRVANDSLKTIKELKL